MERLKPMIWAGFGACVALASTSIDSPAGAFSAFSAIVLGVIGAAAEVRT